jgi:uncharacterized protein (TIGR03086 family)
MTWTPDVTFVQGLDFFSAVVDQVPSDGWERASPCAGWSALDVLGHVGFTTEFGTKLLRAESPDFSGIPDPPRSAVSGNPHQWWRGMVAPAKEALQGVDLDRVVESPIGPRSIREGLSFPAVDLFLHGWDLARSAGVEVTIPDEAMEFAHQALDPIPDQQKRSPRVFAPEVDVPADASSQVKFLAWAGRDATGS